jgi:hypothetical protein
MRSFMICRPTSHQILFGWSNQGGYGGWGLYQVWGKIVMHTGFWLGNLGGREHMEGLGMGKAKKKKVSYPCPFHEGIRRGEVQLHSFLTSALGGDEWPNSRPNHFTLEREGWYPQNLRLGGPQSRSGRFWRRESLLPMQTEACVGG